MNKFWGAILLAGPLALGACGEDTTADEINEPAATNVIGEVKEWSVAVDTATVPAGEVTFTITNTGTMLHEFLVVKTDLPDGEIPVDGDRFSETLDSITVIDEIAEYAAGTTETLTVYLDAGKYQLVCNIPAHYGLGMHTPFTVG